MDDLTKALQEKDVEVVLLKKPQREMDSGDAANEAAAAELLPPDVQQELAASDARGDVPRRTPTSVSLPKRADSGTNTR